MELRDDPAAPGVSRHPSQAVQGAACKGGAAQQSDCPSSKIHGAKPHLFTGCGDSELQLGTAHTSLPMVTTGHAAWEKPGSEAEDTDQRYDR